MKRAFFRSLALAGALLLLYVFCAIRQTPIGIGLRVPTVFAQQALGLACPGTTLPLSSLTLRANNGQLFNWGCQDTNGGLYIGGQSWLAPSSTDLGASEALACSNLPLSGGTISIVGTSIVNTPLTDCGKTVALQIGTGTLICNATCIILRSAGSSVTGYGDQSILSLPSTLPCTYGINGSTGIIVARNPENNINNVQVQNLKIVNNRNCNVGNILVMQNQASTVSNIHCDGTNAYTVCIEGVDGFANSWGPGNYAQHGTNHGILYLLSAPTQNTDNQHIYDSFDFAGTFFSINAPVNSIQPTTLDGITVDNPSHSYATGPVAKYGLTTLNGATIAGATTIVVASGAACTVNYPIRFGNVSSTEGNNIVTNIAVNTLTLMFPAQLAHSNGDQVFCGSVAAECFGNTLGMDISQGHFEGAGIDFLIRNCRNVNTRAGVYSVTAGEGGIIGDAIRVDPGYNVKFDNPYIDGVTNSINITNAVGAWGAASFNVKLQGAIEGAGLGVTNKGLVNNSGQAFDASTAGYGCEMLGCPQYTGSASGSTRADVTIRASGTAAQINLDSPATVWLGTPGETLTLLGSISGTHVFQTQSAAGGTFTSSAGTDAPVVSGVLTTTGAASDALTLTGVTASSHCLITPTNASAATNIATSFISAVATNSVTLSHTATAGMTYNISCSPI